MGNVSIDLSLNNIWRSWFLFKQGKKKSLELEEFTYHLETNLFDLWQYLKNETYTHGPYRFFWVTDNKKRKIAVAGVADRVIHRLLYEYLVPIYDKNFIFDAWSCRPQKGLIGAIERTQDFLAKHKNGFIWRTDIKKFFDSVDHNILYQIINRKIRDEQALAIIKKIIDSYSLTLSTDGKKLTGQGMPIGNLTSQIFANIYLNELDRFIKHHLKPKAYLRYGDDLILVDNDPQHLSELREKTIDFLKINLHLSINPKSDLIIKAKQGLKFLGVVIYPWSRKLNKRNIKRIANKLNYHNLASYRSLIVKHQPNNIKSFNWQILDKNYV